MGRVVAQLQESEDALEPTVQAFLKSILDARNPPVPVPDGATISRQTVSGVDSLVVTAP